MSTVHILDANETAFWQKELEHMKARTYDIDYPEFNARKVFPVSNEGGEGVRSITYQTWDHAGMAKIISNYASDIPRADVKGTTYTIPVHRMAESFGMTIDEIKEARRVGRSLSNRKMVAVRDGHENKLNDIAFNGDSEHNLMGLFSHPNIPNGQAPNGKWDEGTTTPDDILADIKDGFSNILSTTQRVEIPNALLLPGTYYDHIAMTRLGDGSDTTILDWVVSKIPYLSGNDSVAPLNELEAVTSLAGSALSATSEVAVYYRKDPMKLELEIPEDINFLPSERRGLEEIVLGTMTTGGLNVYKPLSLYIQIMQPQP